MYDLRQPCPCEACKKRRNESSSSTKQPLPSPPSPSLGFSTTCDCDYLVKESQNICSIIDDYDDYEPMESTRQPMERYAVENGLTARTCGCVGAEAGFAYFLKETIGIVGFCVITTFCLWAVIMKYGIKLLTRINRSDKRVRNCAWLLILLIGLIIFQGILFRKVKHITHLKKQTVKITPKKSKIIVAPTTIKNEKFWYKWKNGVTTMWVNCRKSGYKMKIKVIESLPFRNKSRVVNRPSVYAACKETLYKMKNFITGSWIFHIKPRYEKRLSFKQAFKEKLYKMKARLIAAWPFHAKPRKVIRPSYWSINKKRLYNVKTKVTDALKWPSNWKLTSSKTCTCKCPKKHACKKTQNDWKFWSEWHVGQIWTGWLASCCKLKDKLISRPPVEDPVAHAIMKQSKLYAIPMEMKRPPQLLVCLRDYLQQQ